MIIDDECEEKVKRGQEIYVGIWHRTQYALPAVFFCGKLGAVILMQDRENVDNLWEQNQHITHMPSTNNPHIAQFHDLSSNSLWDKC